MLPVAGGLEQRSFAAGHPQVPPIPGGEALTAGSPNEGEPVSASHCYPLLRQGTALGTAARPFDPQPVGVGPMVTATRGEAMATYYDGHKYGETHEGSLLIGLAEADAPRQRRTRRRRKSEPAGEAAQG